MNVLTTNSRHAMKRAGNVENQGEIQDARLHIFTDSRRFAKFPRTGAAPPFVVIVVEKECCTKILVSVNR